MNCWKSEWKLFIKVVPSAQGSNFCGVPLSMLLRKWQWGTCTHLKYVWWWWCLIVVLAPKATGVCGVQAEGVISREPSQLVLVVGVPNVGKSSFN